MEGVMMIGTIKEVKYLMILVVGVRQVNNVLEGCAKVLVNGVEGVVILSLVLM
jgi:hypothetical protein